jgi:hypothetical protein
VAQLDRSAGLSGGWNTAFTAQTGKTIIDGQNARIGLTIDLNTTVSISRLAIRRKPAPDWSTVGR